MQVWERGTMNNIARDKNGQLTITQAMAIVGSIGFPSKMPGMSYGLEAGTTCPSSKRSIDEHGEKSVCYYCYAGGGKVNGGNYSYPSVVAGQKKRLQGISNPLWIEAMSRLINYYRNNGKVHKGKVCDTRYFRFHDSGDIIDLQHLEKIVAVVNNCPTVHFWLPTHEPKIVKLYLLKYKTFPKNLTVRISAELLGEKATTVGNVPTSTVGTKENNSKDNFNCPSLTQDNSCQNCRACWNKNATNINYPLH